MKIVVLKCGVGNQLFQYHLYQYLKQKGHKVYYKDETQWHMAHYGLELDKYFDVKIEKWPWLVGLVLRLLFRFCRSTYNKLCCDDINFNEKKLIFQGFWQDAKYMHPATKIRFKELPLSAKNKAIISEMEQTESVAIHVRRGDYLKPDCAKTYGGICTPEYYAQALQIVRSTLKAPRFFVFSDDINWCKDNLPIENAQYIDWNTGTDSIYDMYLMSHCKANIIANSTFSYWGAQIGNHALVVYPKKWFADRPAPNLFPKDWRGI